MSKLIDITGQKFGRLTVIERYDKKRWKCVCDCGNTTISDSWQLRNGIALSCGCYQREICGDQHRTHGYSKTRLYRIYYKMRERCYRTDNDNYRWYGALGIKVCDEWLNSFQAFKNWSIENGYKDNLTIDRIDPTKNYEPSNCRWVSIQEQQKTRRKRGTIYGSK